MRLLMRLTGAVGLELRRRSTPLSHLLWSWYGLRLVLVRTKVRLGHPPALTPALALPRFVTYSRRRGSLIWRHTLRRPATGRGRSWPSILTSPASATDTPPSPRAISRFSPTCSLRTYCGTTAGGIKLSGDYRGRDAVFGLFGGRSVEVN